MNFDSSIDNFHKSIPPLRSRSFSNIVGKPMTDRKIQFYADRGWYSAELFPY
jgi:hypothetical protein